MSEEARVPADQSSVQSPIPAGRGEILPGAEAAPVCVPGVPLVPDGGVEPAAVEPDKFVLGRTLFVALSQHLPLALVEVESLSGPELVCATARPMPPDRSVAVKSAVSEEMRIDVSLSFEAGRWLPLLGKHTPSRTVPSEQFA